MVIGVGEINNGRSRIEAGEGRATSNVEDRETTDRKTGARVVKSVVDTTREGRRKEERDGGRSRAGSGVRNTDWVYGWDNPQHMAGTLFGDQIGD